MKKWTMVISGVLAALLMVTAFTGEALAWGGPQGNRGARSGGYGFIDEDGDGVNDRYGECDGVPPQDGTGYGYGYGFLDEDGDGVNDRYGECDGVPAQDGTGYGYGYGFIDEDGDGVNDRYGE
ncbi:MAG: hypothetical protein ACP5HM_07910, partial [Anaerolineae bacterium]